MSFKPYVKQPERKTSRSHRILDRLLAALIYVAAGLLVFLWVVVVTVWNALVSALPWVIAVLAIVWVLHFWLGVL